ncbi:DUF6105 family protein [Roseitalea porphyridii]|uniref:Uncharacterized protein n=1 Tax=Roseitalea porphyridii TaxID=1852022 RepID=A0A4P6V193_9HYPH|nr:DUF6105 family protein [Roseitalea porphyridii]QBK30444.1 hypothetical protein E0E05_07440 [Roseitalea porphyridii]
MRYIFWFWFVPMGFLWSWYFLSLNDISLGMGFFSRETHDLVFLIYGHILDLEKDMIVRLLVKACIVDTGLIFAILAFRRRKQIRAWWNARRAEQRPEEAATARAEVQFTTPAE